jgi:methionine-rich copper-binding protein CopC
MHRPHLTAAALATACIALAIPASSFAHAGIKSYSPKPGSAVSRDLSAVRITFKARISDGNLTVKKASGTKVSRGSGRVISKHRAVRALLKTGLKAGRYTATAKWLDTDGHVETKSWSFRLR